MSRNDCWMPFYVGDYLADTLRLTTLQHGAYLLLLMDYWKNGPLPDDDGELAAIVKLDPKAWAAISGRIRKFFTRGSDGLLHQKRMDAEKSRSAELNDKRRAKRDTDAERLRAWRARKGDHPNPPDGPNGETPHETHGETRFKHRSETHSETRRETRDETPHETHQKRRLQLHVVDISPRRGEEISTTTATETRDETRFRTGADARSGLDGQRDPPPTEEPRADPEVVKRVLAERIAELTGKPRIEIEEQQMSAEESAAAQLRILGYA